MGLKSLLIRMAKTSTKVQQSGVGSSADIAVLSYPKSGRTWLRVMLDDLGVEAEYTHAGAEHKNPIHYTALSTSAAERFRRIVFLSRDPRDTVVSAYHQAKWRDRNRYMGTISQFIRDPHFGIEKVIYFNAIWHDLARQNEKILPITYEELHESGVATLSRVLEHFGRQTQYSSILEAIERNRFSRMQAREIAGDFERKYGNRLGAADPSEPNSLKCRSGKIGSFSEELSSVDVAFCDEALAKQAAQL